MTRLSLVTAHRAGGTMLRVEGMSLVTGYSNTFVTITATADA